MKNRHWYFEGYEVKPELRGKKLRGRLVYTGEYYALPVDNKKSRQLKQMALIGCILLIADYLLLSLLPSPCARSKAVSLPLLAALLPLIFLTMSAVSFFFAPEKWPKRLLRSIHHRMRWSALAEVILMTVSLIAELVVCVQASAFSWSELLWTVGLLGAITLVLLYLYAQRRYPAALTLD